MSDSTFVAMLRRLQKRFTPATIIDVGASDGRWSKMALGVWPNPSLVLVEANKCFSQALREFKDAAGHVRTHIALAGANSGAAQIGVNSCNPYQGVTVLRADEVRASPDTETQTVDVIRLDDVTTALHADVAPYLLKLDVHGHEPMVFEGAKEVLALSGAVIVEVYFWEPATSALRFWEMVPLLARYGFRPTDLCEPLYRPSDGRCAQVDMLFERTDAPGMDKWW